MSLHLPGTSLICSVVAAVAPPWLEVPRGTETDGLGSQTEQESSHLTHIIMIWLIIRHIIQASVHAIDTTFVVWCHLNQFDFDVFT